MGSDMFIVFLEIAILLTAILLPVHAGSRNNKTTRYIDRDTSKSQYAINEHGMLERINQSNFQKK
jgi:hypothetical protein